MRRKTIPAGTALRGALGGAALLGLLAAPLLSPRPAFAANPNIVVTTADTGPGSLREAINYANAHVHTTIAFQIPAAMAAGGVFTLQPATPFPPVTGEQTLVDGATQTSFTGNTNPGGPEVVLNGALAGAAVGLSVQGKQ